jgi:hypothetical protein
MATSGTSVFEEARDDLLAEALENVGGIGPGEVRSSNNSELFEAAARSLNRLVKSIDATGMRLWRIVRRTTTTTLGTATVALGSDVLDPDEPMRYTRSGYTTATPLTAMSRDEYMLLPDRTNQGLPNKFYFEKTLTTSTLYLWPVPDATGDALEYAVALRGQDFNSGADTPDFTSKWGTCLVYGLTMELCAKFRQASQIPIWKPLFEAELARVNGDDSPRGAIMFSPFGGFYGGGAG